MSVMIFLGFPRTVVDTQGYVQSASMSRPFNIILVSYTQSTRLLCHLQILKTCLWVLGMPFLLLTFRVPATYHALVALQFQVRFMPTSAEALTFMVNEVITLTSKDRLKISKRLDVLVSSERCDAVMDVGSSVDKRQWNFDPNMYDIPSLISQLHLTNALSSDIWPDSILRIQPYRHHSRLHPFSPNVQGVDIKAEDLLKYCSTTVPGETLGKLYIVCDYRVDVY